MIGNDIQVLFKDGSKRTFHITPGTVADVFRLSRKQDIAGCVMPTDENQMGEMVVWLTAAAFVEACAEDGIDPYPDYYKWARRTLELDLVGSTNPTQQDTHSV